MIGHLKEMDWDFYQMCKIIIHLSFSDWLYKIEVSKKSTHNSKPFANTHNSITLGAHSTF